MFGKGPGVRVVAFKNLPMEIKHPLKNTHDQAIWHADGVLLEGFLVVRGIWRQFAWQF